MTCGEVILQQLCSSSTHHYLYGKTNEKSNAKLHCALVHVALHSWIITIHKWKAIPWMSNGICRGLGSFPSFADLPMVANGVLHPWMNNLISLIHDLNIFIQWQFDQNATLHENFATSCHLICCYLLIMAPCIERHYICAFCHIFSWEFSFTWAEKLILLEQQADEANCWDYWRAVVEVHRLTPIRLLCWCNRSVFHWLYICLFSCCHLGIHLFLCVCPSLQLLRSLTR